MGKRLAILAISALGVAGAFAAPANAARVCVNAHVVVNGQELVNQQTCQEIPPATR